MSTLQKIGIVLLNEPATAHRINIDEHQLYELAESIRDVGLLNPIVVRAVAGGRFEIIAGHRRYLAHKILGRADIECVVREADDAGTEQSRFAENLQREQLSPMEEGIAIQRYAESTGRDTHAIARALNRSEWWVNHRLALVRMQPELCDQVHAGKLPAGAALELAKIPDDRHRNYLLEYAVRSGASVAVIREWVNRWELDQLQNPGAEPSQPALPDAGQAIIIQMPCYLCGTAEDHRELLIARVCRKCDGEVKKS